MAEKTIAVVGASTNRDKYGNKAVRAYVDQGWTVYPVNPRAEEIEGQKCYASIKDVPQPLERVSVYLPPKLTVEALEDIAAAKPNEVWLNPGTESKEAVVKADELGLNIIQACSIVDQGVTPAKYS